MTNTPDFIEIVCSVDANYAPHLAVMLKSLSATNPRSRIRAHVLCDGVDEALRARVASCVPAVRCEWYEVANHPVLTFKPLLQISRATYLRLLIDDILPATIKRILYLDVDLVVNGDVLPLWRTDLGNHVCAAVVDPGIDNKKFAQMWGLESPGGYFNAGMLLIDMDKLRQKPYLKEAIAILDNPEKPCEYADQDALNIVLWGKWLAVDACWNFQREFLYNNGAHWKSGNYARRLPVVIHFTEREKPWRATEWHPFAWLYIKYLMKTSFSREVLSKGNIGVADRLKKWLKYHLERGKFQN